MDILVRRDARLLEDVDNSNISSPAPPCCEQAIEGMWTVRIDPRSPKLEHAVKLPGSLTGSVGVAHDVTLWDTWKELPGNFSGLLDYTMTVTLPALEGQLVLDPGKVNHFAEVWVNGKHVGAKLWPPHTFQTDAFRPGSNEMRIRVGNLVNNNYKMASPSGLVGPVSVKTPTGRRRIALRWDKPDPGMEARVTRKR